MQKTLQLIKHMGHLYRFFPRSSRVLMRTSLLSISSSSFSTETKPESEAPKGFPEPPELNFQKDNIQNLDFKAETKRLLEIVAKSLYQDKEVFIR